MIWWFYDFITNFLNTLLHSGFIFQYSFMYTMDSFNKPKAQQLQVSGKGIIPANTMVLHHYLST